MNVSAITSNKPFSYYEHLKSDLMPCILLQSPGNHHNSPIICLQCTLMETPKYRFGIVVSSYIIAIYFLLLVRLFSIPLNIHHQMFNIENNQRDSTLLQNNDYSSINSIAIKFQTKWVPKLYHVLYNNSTGKNTMSKCQRIYAFTRKYALSFVTFIRLFII